MPHSATSTGNEQNTTCPALETAIQADSDAAAYRGLQLPKLSGLKRCAAVTD